MVESLKELNRICQKPRYKEVGNWMVRHILRDAALPCTWLLLHTPITANQVTLFSIFIGVAGIACFGFSAASAFFYGTLLLQFWYYLDHVDGQIARYRGSASLSGRFFDYIMHHIIHGIVFFPLGFYLYQTKGGVFYLIAGFVLCILMLTFNLTHDTKYKTFFEKLDQDPSLQRRKQKASDGTGSDSARSLPKRIFSFIHKICEMHVLMNIFTLCAALQFFGGNLDFRYYLFIVYLIAIPVLTITKLGYFVLSGVIDKEFSERFTSEN